MTDVPMKTALVVGATGLIGQLLLRRLANADAYQRVKALVRKPLNFSHPRLQEIQYDFDRPNSLLVQADDVFCCLGTTMRQAGSREAFRKVDYQYPMDVARLALANGAKQFSIVTSAGADVGSSFFYNRVKGEVERDLALLNYPTLLIFRPSLLLGDRGEFRLGERVGEWVMKTVRPLIPARYRPIEGAKVADAMIQTAQQGLVGRHVFESEALQQF